MPLVDALGVTIGCQYTSRSRPGPPSEGSQRAVDQCRERLGGRGRELRPLLQTVLAQHGIRGEDSGGARALEEQCGRAVLDPVAAAPESRPRRLDSELVFPMADAVERVRCRIATHG